MENGLTPFFDRPRPDTAWLSLDTGAVKDLNLAVRPQLR